METFGEWLQRQRSLRRLTRKEFAKRVGCSESALQKIEYGERRPSVQIAELMANCLDVPPEARSTFVRVARGELRVDCLPSESKPAATLNLASPENNLPLFPTPLIGRERELEQLSHLLRDPHCHLLTLVGPGGIGKTRLAIEAASSMQDVFDNGVYFVPLASVGSINAVISTMANAIHFAFYGPSDPRVQLLNYLREKQVLLVVDNVEHLLAGEPDQETVTELLIEILRKAARAKLLITSRETLELQVEWVFDVEGLPVPDSVAAEGSAQNTSVELFLQRARRAHVGFSASIDDFPAIARICRLMDGNPLGIELAAAWVRTLSCDEIARQIEGGLDFLSVTTRDLPTRHRSMRAVFDHSWKLLSEEEKQVLARLSVFRGRIRREAAEQIAGATLSSISALIAKSLVRRSGDNRYDLHELVRQFAAEHLAEIPEEQSATQANHGRYYLKYFSQAGERLRTSAQLAVLAELTAEMDNFRAAWDWAITHDEYGLIEQTMRVFFLLYDARGWFEDGLDTLGRAIDSLERAHGHAPPDRTNRVALGRLLGHRSWLAYRLADYEQAQRMLERSMEILRPMNEAHGLVESITFLGMLMEITGNYARALELYSEGLEVATASNDRWYKALCLTLVNGQVAITHGQVKPERAHVGLRDAVADWRNIGDPRFTAFGLRIISQSAFAQRLYDEARASLEESVALNSSVGDRWGVGSAYRGLGVVAQAQGEHQQAVVMFRKSLDTFNELGGTWWVARLLAEMSRSLFTLGNDAEAERVLRESLRIARDIHAAPVALEALAEFASLQAKQGDMEQALEMLLIILSHPASLPETKDRASELRAKLETQLTAIEIEAIQAHTGEKTFEAVVEELILMKR